MNDLLVKINDGIATITLNRPTKLNSFNRSMAFELQSVLDDCKEASIRAVVITGAGKAFSAGQDLAEVVDPNGPGMDKILSEHYNPIITRIRALEKPVVASVNGVAAGAGANIALSCDIVIAAASASFIQAFSKIGLIPDSGGTYFLPRLIGWQKASALCMLGDKVSATEAEQLGMVYKVYPDADFVTASSAIVTSLSQLPTQALAFTKKALNHSMIHSMEQQLEMEDRLQQQASKTEDFKEGVSAFLEKRKPVFRGK